MQELVSEKSEPQPEVLGITYEAFLSKYRSVMLREEIAELTKGDFEKIYFAGSITDRT